MIANPAEMIDAAPRPTYNPAVVTHIDGGEEHFSRGDQIRSFSCS
jgi:hypothetical protein